MLKSIDKFIKRNKISLITQNNRRVLWSLGYDANSHTPMVFFIRKKIIIIKIKLTTKLTSSKNKNSELSNTMYNIIGKKSNLAVHILVYLHCSRI